MRESTKGFALLMASVFELILELPDEEFIEVMDLNQLVTNDLDVIRFNKALDNIDERYDKIKSGEKGEETK